MVDARVAVCPSPLPLRQRIASVSGLLKRSRFRENVVLRCLPGDPVFRRSQVIQERLFAAELEDVRRERDALRVAEAPIQVNLGQLQFAFGEFLQALLSAVKSDFLLIRIYSREGD